MMKAGRKCSHRSFNDNIFLFIKENRATRIGRKENLLHVVGSFYHVNHGREAPLACGLQPTCGYLYVAQQGNGDPRRFYDCIKKKDRQLCMYNTYKRATFFKMTSHVRYCNNVCALEPCGRGIFHFCCDVDPLLLLFFSHLNERFVTEDGNYIMWTLCGRPSSSYTYTSSVWEGLQLRVP